jgi:hypothetical protein
MLRSSSGSLEAFIPIALAGTAFVIAAKILRVNEMEKLFGALKRKLGRK